LSPPGAASWSSSSEALYSRLPGFSLSVLTDILDVPSVDGN
jgi:hypothetical protein